MLEYPSNPNLYWVSYFYTPVSPATSLHHELGVTGSCDGGTVQQVVNRSLFNHEYTISVELKLEGKKTTKSAGVLVFCNSYFDFRFIKCC